MNEENLKKMKNVTMGNNVIIRDFVNLYGCTIGDNSRVGTFVEIQDDVVIGSNCKIQSHSFICSGVTIEDNVFIGHGVIFCNDNHPRSVNKDGELEKASDWESRFVRTTICKGAVIGSGVTILGGVRVGIGALVGAGSVVTKDVADNTTVMGNPAKEKELKN